MKKIMILGASILQLPAIKCALEMNLVVIAVDMNPNAIGFKEKGVISEVISTIDVPAVLTCAKKHDIDGIMTLASDMPMRTVAAVSKEMGLVGVSEETALKATNKAEMRACMQQYGVPIPMFYRVSSLSEFLNVTEKFVMPFIVKPADNSGSRGVYLVRDTSDAQEIMKAYEHSSNYSRSGEIVVEEYMQGPEVSVEALAIDGEYHIIQITDKLTTGAPSFVEMGHSQPTRLDEKTVERIKNVTVLANKAVGITNGPSHTEIIVTEKGPKIVEIGARLGGDCITTHLVPLSTGVDMVKSCIQIALNESPEIGVKWNKGAAIRYATQHQGIIKKITGYEDVTAIPGVKQVSLLKDVGENVTEILDSGSRIGFVIAQAVNADEATCICEEAIKKLVIDIE